MAQFNKAKHISRCLEMAILFEVSANKPGNVNFVVGFEGTRVEHFLASAVAASASFEEAAKRGIAIQNGQLQVNQAGMGELMRDCVADIDAWQHGGNTLLGTVMLFIPLAVAAGMTQIGEKGEFDLKQLRANMKLAVESTTAQDAVNLYDAIAIASPSGLNDAPDLDVNDANSKTRLVEEDVSLYQVFKIGAGYDDICYEWVNNFPIAFELAYPYLMEQLYEKKKCLNTAITHTFLKVLSERPDTFISRKVGLEKTLDVSKDAKNVLELGGLDTPKGRESILLFDRKLRECGNNYNPGTTADITAATLALGTLSGYRP
ncbi:MAG: triphosphoribosyl-dephospho-CoA synthase [Candidatus Bathyarchaeia archaeon]|jgi:triphosphoribosyl-dephospho-CoA synthase